MTAAAVAGLLAAGGAPPAAGSPGFDPLTGTVTIHDPSTIIRENNAYRVFGTGQGILSRVSSNLVSWTAGPAVFTQPPAWTTNAVPGFTGAFWAPDVILAGGEYRLYYSVSTWGSQVSAIGLATSPTLDPAAPGYGWTDRGLVIGSQAGDPYNTIDPCVCRDPQGRIWLSFGSYWNGIYIVELDPATGLRLSTNSPITRLADHSSIEASCLFERGGYYFLFVNWGSCCSGVDSTYHIRVGRATSPTGPFLDRDGNDLRSAGGTLFLEATGRYVGPGHAGILVEGTTNWLSYHYYDAAAGGTAKLDIRRLEWTDDGWPAFTNTWASAYGFEQDARDDLSGFHGVLNGAAAVTSDPVRGRVLALSGSGDHVSLPQSAAYARTLAAWVWWDGGEAWSRVFDFSAGTNRYLYLTPKSGGGRLRFGITTSGPGGPNYVEAPWPLPTGVWTHVAVTLDGRQGRLYVGGLPVATNANLTLLPSSVRATNLWLGRSAFAADPYFTGKLDGVRLFGRALDAAEIALLPWLDSDLLAHYKLDGPESNVARDFTAHRADAEGHGPPAAAGAGLLFDGARDYLVTPVPNGPARTLAAWIFPHRAAQVPYIESVFDTDVPGQYGSGWGLDNGQIKVILDDAFWSPNVAVVLSNWIHVALAFDPFGARLYTNGLLAASRSLTQGVVSAANYWIGRSHANELYFAGAIDDARIYARALSADEIAALPAQRLPRLDLTPAAVAGTAPRLSWPAWAADYRLETAEFLEPLGTWGPSAGDLAFSGGVFRAEASAAGPTTFFRLAK